MTYTVVKSSECDPPAYHHCVNCGKNIPHAEMMKHIRENCYYGVVTCPICERLKAMPKYLH